MWIGCRASSSRQHFPVPEKGFDCVWESREESENPYTPKTERDLGFPTTQENAKLFGAVGVGQKPTRITPPSNTFIFPHYTLTPAGWHCHVSLYVRTVVPWTRPAHRMPFL
jgi:hypothetical protein